MHQANLDGGSEANPADMFRGTPAAAVTDITQPSPSHSSTAGSEREATVPAQSLDHGERSNLPMRGHQVLDRESQPPLEVRGSQATVQHRVDSVTTLDGALETGQMDDNADRSGSTEKEQKESLEHAPASNAVHQQERRAKKVKARCGCLYPAENPEPLEIMSVQIKSVCNGLGEYRGSRKPKEMS